MENWGWLVDVFAFIGMMVCIIIALIAIVWVTCFAVKLLVKTFSVRVGKSYDLMVEDITKKSGAKKERNEIKRQASLDKKKEILNLKLESKQKIHDMKKQKLEKKLREKENKAKEKLLIENTEDVPDSFEPEQEPEIIEVYKEFENKKTSAKSKRITKSKDAKTKAE